MGPRVCVRGISIGGGICFALWEMEVGIKHSCRMSFHSAQFPHRPGENKGVLRNANVTQP